MKRHAGFTTFTVTLLLILILVGISLLVGKLMVADRKISVNEVQYRQALALAELGIADGMGRVSLDPAWRTAGTTVSTAQGTYLLTATSAATVTVDTLEVTPVELKSTATLPSNLGSATVRVQVAGYQLFSTAKAVPLMVAGGSDIGGALKVVANPNGGGPGVPLSAWSNQAVGGNGSWQTCHQGDYSGGKCSANLSYSNNIGPDIKANDPTFPPDLLWYLFGEPDTAAGWANMFNNGAIALSSCSSLGAASTGIFIVDVNVDCDLSATPIGSTAAPVVLIVRDGDLALNGNLVFNGIIFAHSTSTPRPKVTANGTAIVNGSLIANAPLDLSNGNFTVRYDQAVLSAIQQGARFQSTKMVPGSWRDWD
ncbi:PilX N-terminal domain-containing pilus assembly protein [Aeromonas caviae]